MRLLLSVLLGMSLLAGCKQEAESLSPSLDQFFPIRQGGVRLYAARDSNVTTVGVIGRSYFIKETYQTPFELNGRTLYPIRRDTSSSISGGFDLEEVWHHGYLSPYAERQEGNIRRLVLAYPVTASQQWDINLYNNLGSQQASYLLTDTTVTLNGVTYEHCAKVLWRRRKTLAFDFETYEIYAPGVGMIVRYDRYYEFDLGLPSRPRTTNSYFSLLELQGATGLN